MIREPGVQQNTFTYHNGDGYYYIFNGGNESVFWFRCSIRSCYGTARFDPTQGLQPLRPHNHPAQMLRHNIRERRRAIVNRAASLRYVSFVDIVREERQRTANPAIRVELTYRRLRSAMQRRRGSVFPNVPTTMRMLTGILQNQDWDFLTRTLDNEQRTYCCSVTADDGTHSIVFSSPRCLEILKETSTIFLDGTFKITPSIGGCYQVFTIVTIISHTVIPLVWCWVESKTQSAYTAVLLQIRARIMPYSFRLAVSDYEDAIINAVEAVFGVEVMGCFFHYVNDLGSWVKRFIGAALIQMMPQMIEIIRKACALPLLPQNYLQRGMDVISMEAQRLGPWFNIVQPFLEHVQIDWLFHINRGRTLSVCGSDHRTNNASESNNHRMNRSISTSHPNIHHFIRYISEFEASTIDDVASLRLGIQPNRHRPPSAISRDEFIQELTSNLELIQYPTDQHISDFLSSAAYSVERLMLNALGLPNPGQLNLQ